MGFISNLNILLVLQHDLVYLNVHMMLYFCAIDTDWYYTDRSTSASFRCLCQQVWYRRRPEATPVMQKLAQTGPVNRGLHCGPHKKPPDTSKRSETKTVIRYQISKPSCNIMLHWHAWYSYRWSQRKHVHLKHSVTHVSHSCDTDVCWNRYAERQR